jgi:hypothetical protein
MYSTTNTDGAATVKVGRWMVKPALGLHGKARATSFYVRLEGEGALDAGTLRLHRWTDPGAALPDESTGGEVTSGPLTVHIPRASKVSVDLALAGPGEDRFHARSIPVAEAPPFVRAVPGVTAAVAIAPFGTQIDPRAAIVLRNEARLPAGAAVDVFVQTTDLSETAGPWAGFTRVAPGHVSDDGTTVHTDDSAGVPELSWVAIRLAR